MFGLIIFIGTGLAVVFVWMYLIGAFDKWPEVVYGKQRAERIAREEMRKGYHLGRNAIELVPSHVEGNVLVLMEREDDMFFRGSDFYDQEFDEDERRRTVDE